MLEVVSSREAIVLAETLIMFTQVKTFIGFVQLLVDVVFRLVNLQLCSVEDFYCLDVSSVKLVSHIITMLMKSLQFTGAGHVLDFFA